MAESGWSSEDMRHAVNLGGYYLEAGLRDLGEWSKQMVEDAGDEIRPYLRLVWEEANRQLDEAYRAEREAPSRARRGETIVCEICGRPRDGDMDACPDCGSQLSLAVCVGRPSDGGEAPATETTEPRHTREAWELLLRECRKGKKPWLAFVLALCLGPLGVFYIGVNFGLSAVVVWGILAAPAAMWAPSWHWMVWVANLLLAIHAADLAQKRNALLSASLLAMAEAPTSEELAGVFNFWSGPYAITTLAGEFLPSAAFWMTLVEMVRQAIGLFRDHAIGAGILVLLLSWLAASVAAWFYGLVGGIVALLGTGIHWLAAKLSRQPLWFPDA